MRTRILVGLCCVALSVSMFLNGCAEVAKAPTSSDLVISLQEQIPTASVGKSYDLTRLIVDEEGVTYDYSASYIDPDSGETKKLNVKKGTITPKAEADISATPEVPRSASSSAWLCRQ